MQYNKRILKVLTGESPDSILEKLSGFKEEIAVNLATAPDDAGILFSPENLRTLLKNKLSQLYIDTVNQTDYCHVMQQEIAHLLEGSAELRKSLRTFYCCDLVTEVSEFLSHLQNVCIMLECLTINKSCSGLQPQLLTLRQSQEQLSECCFFLEDSALALDTLQYEINSSLMHLLSKFPK